ncbi:MAG: TonB-dependent receptor [Marinilabilia sp.]
MRTLNILFFSIVICLPLSLKAQEENPFSKDVRVVREFTPEVSDASKINQMPEREDTLDMKPEFDYRVRNHVLRSTPEIETLEAAGISRRRDRTPYSSYARGGLGNYQMLFGDIFYNITRNEKYAFALSFGQESSWGDLDLEDGTSVDAPYHLTDGALYLRHFFDDKTLEFDLGFDRHAYRYYGYQTIDPELPYESGENVYTGEELMPDEKQRQTGFDLHVGLKGQQSDEDNPRYHAAFDFGAFETYTGMGENSFALTGDLKLPFSGLGLFIDGGAKYHKVNAPRDDNDNPGLYDFDDREQIFLTMNPRVVIPGNKLSVEVGINATGEFTGDEEFYLSPHVKGDLVIAEGIVSSFVGMTGEVHPNTYRDVMSENPFVSPDELVKTAFSNIKGFAGVKGNFSSATSFTARFDYEYIENEHFYENRFFPSPQSDVDFGMSNLFRVVYSDATLLTLSGELLVRPVNELDIVLKGAYYGWELDMYDHAWHKPEMELGLRAGYEINEEWQVDAALNILGERYARYVDNPEEIKELDAVTDFNLSANYQYNKQIHFFGRFQNIFAAKYYKWAGYPMQGLNFRLGAGYSF